MTLDFAAFTAGAPAALDCHPDGWEPPAPDERVGCFGERLVGDVPGAPGPEVAPMSSHRPSRPFWSCGPPESPKHAMASGTRLIVHNRVRSA